MTWRWPICSRRLSMVWGDSWRRCSFWILHKAIFVASHQLKATTATEVPVPAESGKRDKIVSYQFRSALKVFTITVAHPKPLSQSQARGIAGFKPPIYPPYPPPA
jgi:hypothetical protein